MAMKNRHGMYWITALFLAVVLVVGALHGCKREKPEPTPSTASTDEGKAAPAAEETAKSPLETATNLFREPKASIQNIVNAAKDRWTPAFEPWWDRPAPDFTLTDLEGQAHRLSDYKGKEVVIAFFTTWAGAAKVVVPPLKELRNEYSKDKLAILAVSSEPTTSVKTFAADQGVNFTVLTSSASLPTPFDQVKVSPTTFFVGADGRFKIAIEGMVPVTDAKAIVQAQ